ncbi:MAG: hypothetical protein WC378_19620 [Opitutaceae bacterium]|jgi:hypothetical protein
MATGRYAVIEAVKDEDTGICEIRLAGRDGEPPADVGAWSHAGVVPLIWEGDDAEPVGVLGAVKTAGAAGLRALASFGRQRRQQGHMAELLDGKVAEIELSIGRDGRPHVARLWAWDPRTADKHDEPREEVK